MVHQATTSDNEWQQVTRSGTTSDNEWQRVTTSGTKSDNQWQSVTTNGSEWQRVRAVVQRMKTAQCTRIDDCNHFNDKKRYTNGMDMAAIRVVK